MTTDAVDRVVRVRAPGKINVFLGVGALQDDGYHEVATAYQAVSLYEDVQARDAPDFSVSFSGTIDTAGLATDGSNLALRAATLLAHRTGYRRGVRLQIDKNVPVAGGMGGGSADAAATLLACDALWGTGLHRDELVAIAAELGADVPFALLGGTAIGTGRGEQLSPALASGHVDWVLVLADYGLSTPEVYAELDRHRERHAGDIGPAAVQPQVEPAVLHALRAGDPVALAECLHNDLQAAALKLEPRLGEVLELGERNGALAGVVSGSGPTLAFLVEDGDSALELQVSLAASGHHAVRVSGPVPGARILE